MLEVYLLLSLTDFSPCLNPHSISCRLFLSNAHCSSRVSKLYESVHSYKVMHYEKSSMWTGSVIAKGIYCPSSEDFLHSVLACHIGQGSTVWGLALPMGQLLDTNTTLTNCTHPRTQNQFPRQITT